MESKRNLVEKPESLPIELDGLEHPAGGSESIDAAKVKLPSSHTSAESLASGPVGRGEPSGPSKKIKPPSSESFAIGPVVGGEPSGSSKIDTSAHDKASENIVNLGGRLRQLDTDRRAMDRALHALERTVGKESKSYASRTLTPEMVDTINDLKMLRTESKKTTDAIRKGIGRPKWAKEDRYMTPETKGKLKGLTFTVAASIAKEIAWYGTSKIKNFYGQFAASLAGALGFEYTFQTKAAFEWGTAGGDPSSFQGSSQAIDMGVTPTTLAVINRVTHQPQSGTSNLPFLAFALTSTINSGYKPEWLKRLMKARGNNAEDFVANAGDDVTEPKGVQATKQARDIESLIKVLPESDHLGQIQQRISDAKIHLESFKRERSKRPAATEEEIGAEVIGAAPDTEALKTHLRTTENGLRRRQKWSRREYGAGAGSLAVYALALGVTEFAAKKHPSYRSTGELLTSVLPQGVAQLATFIHIPGEDKIHPAIRSHLKIAPALAVEYIALQLGTKHAAEAPGTFPDIVVNRYGQEALRGCVGPLTSKGLAGDELRLHHVVGCLSGLATAGTVYGVEWAKAQKNLETPLLPASHNATAQHIPRNNNKSTVNADKSEMKDHIPGRDTGSPTQSDPKKRSITTALIDSPYSHSPTPLTDKIYNDVMSSQNAGVNQTSLVPSARYSKQIERVLAQSRPSGQNHPSRQSRLART